MRTSEKIASVELKAEVDLTALSQGGLEVMAEAGREVVDVHRVLAKSGDNLVGELLRNQGNFYEWDHYPPGDVYDHETHGQYYYHAHPVSQRFEGEHGHFHTFLRPKGMPAGVAPAAVPDLVKPTGDNDALSHLIAISMTGAGFPYRLFTVNRWVTGETWYPSAGVIKMLDHFEIDHARPSWPVNRWITALVRLYRPQIEALLKMRDETVAQWQGRQAAKNIFENRDLEVTSYLDIDVEAQIRAIGRILAGRGLV